MRTLATVHSTDDYHNCMHASTVPTYLQYKDTATSRGHALDKRAARMTETHGHHNHPVTSTYGTAPSLARGRWTVDDVRSLSPTVRRRHRPPGAASVGTVSRLVVGVEAQCGHWGRGGCWSEERGDCLMAVLDDWTAAAEDRMTETRKTKLCSAYRATRPLSATGQRLRPCFLAGSSRR
jgi:hypothetical protein